MIMNTKQLKKLLEGSIEEKAETMKLLHEEDKRKLVEFLCEESGMEEEDVVLLLRFAQAAGNLYGRIPLEDFYRIVRELAPEIRMDQKAFLSFMRALDNKEHLFIVDPEDQEDLPETVTMDCDLAAEWVVYDFDDAYDALLEHHSVCPRYIPAREEFLRYEDEFYFEETPEKQNMRKFLQEKCGLQGEESEDFLEEILMFFHIATDLTPEHILMSSVNSYTIKEELYLRIISQSQEFLQCFGDLYEHMRFVYTNAYTLAELRKMQAITGIEVEPEADFSKYELVPQRTVKIGRNDPCPCGSGKKYKKCCGRGK